MRRTLCLLGTVTVVCTAPSLAQYAQIDRAVQDATPRMVQIRHQLHQHPELGNREFETAKLIADYLRGLGLDEVRTEVAHTGVVGVLRGGRPGPVVAVRADMDALPVTEDTPFPFKSMKNQRPRCTPTSSIPLPSKSPTTGWPA